MTSRFVALISELATRFGETAPTLASRDSRALADGRFLLAQDNVGLVAGIERRLAAPDASLSTVALAAALQRDLGLHVVAWANDRAGALAAATTMGRDRRGAATVLDPLDQRRTPTAASQATPADAACVVDETDSAFRIRDGLAYPSAGLATEPDFVVIGASLAAGLPFGAVLAHERRKSIAGLPPTATVRAVVLATLERLVAGGAAERLATMGERLRARFQAACKREDLNARLVGPPAHMRFEFDGQENAEAPLLLHHLGLELEGIGAVPGSGLVLLQPDVDLDFLVDAVDRAAARMRCLLIEHNSYMCGEIPFPFPDGNQTVIERGMALYRFPKLGAVDLISDPAAGSFRIRFRGGELGEVTSSGFFLPTLFTGDFEIECRYEIHAWEPGPDSACLALFAQNLASSARYYAQHMSSGEAPDQHRVLGVLGGVVGEPIQVGAARTGQLRVRRLGAELTTWHRLHRDDEWTRTASDSSATTDDVVFGAKIWSKIECGKLEATLHELRIDGRLAAEQIPRLEHRQDPRGSA